MSNAYWTLSIAFVCIFWGIAVLFNQHHLSNLIPTLGGYLLAYGVGLLVAFFWREHRGGH